MEGGEWGSFNGVYVNEEADFMAQMFPTNCSMPNSNEVDGHSSLSCWSNNFNMANGSAYPSSDAANSSMNSYFPQDNCYSGGSGVASYPIPGHETYYTCDNISLFEFLDEKAEGENNLGLEKEELGEVEHTGNKRLLPKIRSEMSLELEDETSNCSDISKKRARASDVRKGRRKAAKSKKRQKAGVVEEDNNADMSKHTTSGCSSEDESNLSLELNNGASSKGKTRASRGSATDPQSLYARKRRERINDRLKVLQSIVPNGTKVDISTMLEEAVLYVKFLQVQIKLLSSDDLWMYAPIAYNGMDIGLNHKFSTTK